MKIHINIKKKFQLLFFLSCLSIIFSYSFGFAQIPNAPDRVVFKISQVYFDGMFSADFSYNSNYYSETNTCLPTELTCTSYPNYIQEFPIGGNNYSVTLNLFNDKTVISPSNPSSFFNDPTLQTNYLGRFLGPATYADKPSVVFSDVNASYAQVYMMIRIPQPLVSEISVFNGYCPSDMLHLKANINWQTLSGLNYAWQYSINGGTTWKNISQNTQDLNLQYQSIPEIYSWMDNATGSQYIKFRVSASGSDDTSIFSSDNNVLLNPPPPVLSNITTEKTCLGKATGSIRADISGIKGNSFLYILEKGNSTNKPACNPNDTTGGSCTGNVERSKRVLKSDANGVLNIYNVPVSSVNGIYTLWISNDDPYICTDQKYSVIIDSYNALGKSVTTGNISCNGGTDGSITATSSGGKTGAIAFKLIPQTGPPVSNLSGSFNVLKAGTYSLEVSDGCGDKITQSITLTEPPKITLANISTPLQSGDATCNNIGNGQLSITVSKTPGASVSSNYYYRLTKSGDPAFLRENTTSQINNIFSGLSNGDYLVLVKEAGGADCNAFSQNVTIAGPGALQIVNILKTNVLCGGASTGKISFQGLGNSSGYYYRITDKNNALNSFTNTAGVFDNLAAGTYIPTLFRHLPDTCHDIFTGAEITISQTLTLSLNINKQDISCFEDNDGKININITGGTPPYLISKNGGAGWDAVTGSSYSFTSLSDNDYEIVVKDANSCRVLSGTISINRPPLLMISSVKINDIKCLGDKGSIVIAAKGGTLPYTFEFSIDGGNKYTVFDNNTSFDAGNYIIRLKDSKGCIQLYNNPVVITSPSQALDFNYTLSNYNGYNISCKGSKNGKLYIKPTGGNGARYSGYEIALDGGNFTNADSITGIFAGSHMVYMRDARGCKVSKLINFTESDLQLSLQLVNKTDILCSGDNSGIIEVNAIGGLAPFTYSIDTNKTLQTQSKFEKLSIGTYLIVVNDKNNCSSRITVDIKSIYPPMIISPVINSVSCFGGNDGKIKVNLSGVGPFTYTWEGRSEKGNEINNLTAGVYNGLVHDNNNCSKKISIILEQPIAPLSIKVTAKPVCYGKANGEIKIVASGGNNLYLYSIDNGLTYQNTPFFNAPEGQYAVVVKDKMGCSQIASVTVDQSKDKPTPDFLVSTTQTNALDTLVIKEISYPKVDSVSWIFDPKAAVIDSNNASPKIKFDTEGSYQINMTGYLGGCDYSITKLLTIKPYDPNVKKISIGIKPIELLIVSPNPNNGEFNIHIKLIKKQPIKMVIYDVLGNQKGNRSWENMLEIDEKIAFPNLSEGLYLIRVVTANDAGDIRINITN